MVVASKDKKLANAAQQLLASGHLRISTSRYCIRIKSTKLQIHCSAPKISNKYVYDFVKCQSYLA